MGVCRGMLFRGPSYQAREPEIYNVHTTDSHVQHYRRQGYCLVRGLIPREDIVPVLRRTLEIIKDPPAWPERHFQILDPARYRSSRGHALPGGIQRPAAREQVFRNVANHPNLIDAMTSVLGGDVELFTDQIGVKHGAIVEEQGGRSYHHQDSFYWHIDPSAGCNCWIPTSSVGPDAIALAVVPRSHIGWHLIDHESYYDDPPLGRLSPLFEPFKRHRVPLEHVDPMKEVLIPMEPGDGLFFTNYTWHRSEPNRTGETKAFYAIAYRTAKS